jgi:gas vesicle protein
MMNRGVNFLGGILLGSAIGVVSALLLAPDSGKRTRKKLKKKSRKYSKDAVQAVRQYLMGRKKNAAKNEQEEEDEIDVDKKNKLAFYNK